MNNTLLRRRGFFALVGMFVAGAAFLVTFSSAHAAGITISKGKLNGGLPITLGQGTTTIVMLTASTTDVASTSMVATATIYRTSLGSSCTADPYNCYQLSGGACTFTAATGTTKNLTCLTAIYWFAQPTDASSSNASDSWSATINVMDTLSHSGATTTAGVELNTLNTASVNVSSINYGTVLTGSDTGANDQILGVTNTGNAVTTASISGSAPTFSTFSLQPGVEHYATSSFTYGGSEQALSTTSVTVSGLSIPPGPLGPSWNVNKNALPAPLETEGVIAASGTMYVIGGLTTGQLPTSTVSMATINANGTVGAFTSTSPLPAGWAHFGMPVIHGGYIYIAGGLVAQGAASGTTSSVIFAKINTDGTLGTWGFTTPLPSPLAHSAPVADNGFLYVIGGTPSDGNGNTTATVQFAPFAASGTIGSWTNTTPLPYAEYKAFSVSSHGVIYLPGGEVVPDSISTSTFQYTIPSTSTGAIGTWIQGYSLPDPMEGYNLQTDGSFIYMVGGDATGHGGNTSTLQFASLNAGGVPSGWDDTAAPLSYITSRNQGALYNGYLYNVGGLNGPNNDTSSIDYIAAATPIFLGSRAPAGTATGTYSATITVNPNAASFNVTSTMTVAQGARSTQNDFEWFNNANAITPGTSLAAQDASTTVPVVGNPFRLRMNVTATSTAIAPGSNFELQYATSTGGPWTNLGIATNTPWAFYNNSSVNDGQTITSTILSSSNLGETYDETNPATNTPATIGLGQNAEWDWSIQNQSAKTSTPWYFRMAYSNGRALESYTHYPLLAGATPISTSTPPQSLVATPQNTQVLLSWTAPSSTGGTPITQYLAYDRLTGGSSFTLVATSSPSQTTTTVGSLTNNVSYDFEVLAQNAVGTSSPSNIASTTPSNIIGWEGLMSSSTYSVGSSTFRVQSTATPDTNVAVGQNQICELVNNAMECWNKSDLSPAKIFGNTFMQITQPWTQVSDGGPDNNGNTPHCGDNVSPNVNLLHDDVNNRWIINRRVVGDDGNTYACVAVSNVDNVSQSSGPAFEFFAFEYNLSNVIPSDPSGAEDFYPDFPQAGLWNTGDSHATLWVTYDLMLNESVTDPNWGGPQPVPVGTIYGVLTCGFQYGYASSTNGLLNSSVSATTWINAMSSSSPQCKVNNMTAYNNKRSWDPATNEGTIAPTAGEQERLVYLVEPMNNTSSIWLSPATDTTEALPVDINWSLATPTTTVGTPFDFASPAGTSTPVGAGCFYPGNYYATGCIVQPFSVSSTIGTINSGCSGGSLRECDVATTSQGTWSGLGQVSFQLFYEEDSSHRLVAATPFYTKTFTGTNAPNFYNIPSSTPALNWDMFFSYTTGTTTVLGDSHYSENYLTNTSNWTISPDIGDTYSIVGTYDYAECSVYSGSGNLCVDSVGDRVNQRLVYRNVAIATSTCGAGNTCPSGLWTYAYQVAINQGVYPTSTDAQYPPYQVMAVNPIFWHQNSGPTFNTKIRTATSTAWNETFLPSCTLDKLGDNLCVYDQTTVSPYQSGNTPTNNAPLPGAAPFISGSLGEFNGQFTGAYSPWFNIKTTNNYQPEGTDTPAYRWGNWNSATVDPDGCTFYVGSEYLNHNRTEPNTGIWNTWLAKIYPVNGCN